MAGQLLKFAIAVLLAMIVASCERGATSSEVDFEPLDQNEDYGRMRPAQGDEPRPQIVTYSFPGTTAASDPTIMCPFLNERMKRSECKELTDYYNHLATARPSILSAREMQLGETYEVRFMLNRDGQALEAASRAGEEIELGSVKVSPEMSARLFGEGFTIEERSPATIEPGASRRYGWTWRVTPTQHGTRTLRAELTLLLASQNSDRVVEKVEFDRPIRVKVGALQSANMWIEDVVPFLKNVDALIAAISAVLVGIVGLIAIFRD